MLESLSQGFKDAFAKFNGKTTLSEANVESALEVIRTSLLEADVEYRVTNAFTNQVKQKAVGTKVSLKAGGQRVSPGDHFVKICQEELVSLMGPANSELTLPSNRPASIMMVGLQGAGKTTACGKIAKFMREKKSMRPLLVAADIYRPAAVEQLKTLGKSLDIPVFHEDGQDPVTICRNARKAAIKENHNVILYDTAGRLTIDDELMVELENIKAECEPDNILLVCDAMMGQDAVTTATAFNDRLDLSGFILTKLDGDARGGAALSIKYMTGKPIKFLGTGEAMTGLEEFRPEGLASRILGMGDVVGLMQDFEKVAHKESEEDALRMLKGSFTFGDFYNQIQMIQKMGSLKDLVAKLPMQNMIPEGADVSDHQLVKIKAMIDSMTEKERTNPDLLNPSRINRIARGSGHQPKEVLDLVTKFKTMRQMMGKMGKRMGGLMGKIPGMNAMKGLSQLRNLDPSALGNMAGGMGNTDPFGAGDAGQIRRVDRDKLKKNRKAAKKSRKANRKRK